MASQEDRDRTIATNRRARHEYEILETLEAGLVLRGTEVKSLRDGQLSFKDSYATVRNGEIWLLGCHINPYSHGTDANHDPERDRKLLLHRKEIDRMAEQLATKGMTLVPDELHFRRGYARIVICLATGKDRGDKRQDLIKRAMKRDVDREMSRRMKNG